METIGARLKSERERLGLNQDEFAVLGGVQRKAQWNYEMGNRYPDAGYLAAVANKGADVLYIVTGSRAITKKQFADDVRLMSDAWATLETALYRLKKALPPEKKRAAAEALFNACKQQPGVNVEQMADLMLKVA